MQRYAQTASPPGARKRRRVEVALLPNWLPVYIAGDHVEFVENLTRGGVDVVNFRVPSGSGTYTNTAFLLAVRAGALRTVEYMLELGADVVEHAALGPSVQSEDSRMFELLAATLSVHELKKNFTYPLNRACMVGNLAVVRYLHQCGMPVATMDTEREYLGVSAYFGRMELVEYLLQCGADVHTPNSFSSTPLHQAASSGRRGSNASIVRLLVEEGADLAAVNDHGRTPLMGSFFSSLTDEFGELLDFRRDILQALISAGCDVRELGVHRMERRAGCMFVGPLPRVACEPDGPDGFFFPPNDAAARVVEYRAASAAVQDMARAEVHTCRFVSHRLLQHLPRDLARLVVQYTHASYAYSGDFQPLWPW